MDVDAFKRAITSLAVAVREWTGRPIWAPIIDDRTLQVLVSRHLHAAGWTIIFIREQGDPTRSYCCIDAAPQFVSPQLTDELIRVARARLARLQAEAALPPLTTVGPMQNSGAR